ncbi:hypothetical protein ID866_7402 [Astraeus odoratus]|nr:hypothetical protein ID866_7402 [Astraeus odoratus]
MFNQTVFCKRMNRRRPYNVIIFGEIGAGKSSLANLIVGRPVAKVSPDVTVCTTESKGYSFTQDSIEYKLWDTPGLQEPQADLDDQAPAITELCHLLRRLEGQGGADLLVYCISGLKDITIPSAPPSTLQSHYRLFRDILFPGIPLVLVVTYLRLQEQREKWWAHNERKLTQLAISFAGHVCVTAHAATDPADSELEESRKDVRALLKHCSQKSHWGTNVLRHRFRMTKEVVKSLPSLAWSKRDMTLPEYATAGMLVTRCGQDKEDAVELVKRMRVVGSLSGAISVEPLTTHTGVTSSQATISQEI